MSQLTRYITVAAMIGILVAPAAVAAESPSVLLQKGIFAEETEGNLDAAIKIYEQITAEGAVSRSVVAQAQYRLGVCYQKKGQKEEATVAFRKLVDQFSSEKELVEKSCQRLSELGQPMSAVVVRQVWAPALDPLCSVSADGRYLAFTDWETGDVAIRDLSSGHNRRLTNKGSWASSDFALYPIISPDGKDVVYWWYDDSSPEKSFDVRLVSVENPKPRVLADRHVGWCQPEDWSSDGKQIVAQVSKTGEVAIVLFAPEQGSMRELKALGHLEPSTVRFSPDGRFLVYARGSLQEPERDIFALNVADGTETPLIQHPANDEVLDWSPDGATLLFRSDRSGGMDVWAVQVQNGKTKGAPYLVKPNIGSVYPLGSTRDGRFFYGVYRRGGAIHRARLDWETGKVIEPPAELPLRSGDAMGQFSVSPDGRYLVFGAGTPPRWSWRLFELETRRERELVSLARYGRCDRPQWLSDNRTVTLWATRRDGGVEFSLLDTVTGQTTAIFRDDRGRDTPWWMRAGIEPGTITYVRWDASQSGFFVVQRDLKSGDEQRHLLRKESAPDARCAFFANAKEKTVDFFRMPRRPTESDPGLYACFEIKTGKTRELLKLPCYFERRAYFEDANRLALGDPSEIAVVANDGGSVTVRLLEFTDGQARERRTVPLPKRATVGDWAPGGRDLVILRPGAEPKRPSEVWLLSAQTGDLRKTELAAPEIRALDLSHAAYTPKGELFFLVREPALQEVWVMENAVPGRVATTE